MIDADIGWARASVFSAVTVLAIAACGGNPNAGLPQTHTPGAPPPPQPTARPAPPETPPPGFSIEAAKQALERIEAQHYSGLSPKDFVALRKQLDELPASTVEGKSIALIAAPDDQAGQRENGAVPLSDIRQLFIEIPEPGGRPGPGSYKTLAGTTLHFVADGDSLFVFSRGTQPRGRVQRYGVRRVFTTVHRLVYFIDGVAVPEWLPASAASENACAVECEAIHRLKVPAAYKTEPRTCGECVKADKSLSPDDRRRARIALRRPDLAGKECVARCAADLSARKLPESKTGRSLPALFDEIRVPRTKLSGMERIQFKEDFSSSTTASTAGATSTGVNAGSVVEAFTIDRTEVSVREYAACVAAGACTRPALSSRPMTWQQRARGENTGRDEECRWGAEELSEAAVNCVAREQAEKYCAWVGKRLPTLGEWIAASRGGHYDRFKSPTDLDRAFCATIEAVPLYLFRRHEDRFRQCAVGTESYSAPSGMKGLLSLAEWTASLSTDHAPILIGGRGGPTWLSGSSYERKSGVVRQESLSESVSFEAPGLWNKPDEDVGFRCAR